MKKFAFALCMAGMLSTEVVYGVPQVTLAYDPFTYTENSQEGGEFRAFPGGTPSLLSSINTSAYAPVTSGILSGQYYFQTFCIETNENFNPNIAYNASISANAMYGNQPPSGDPVSIGTAWLYSQFAAGTLVGLTAGNVASPYDYIYGSGRVTSAGALQKVIWWLEEEPIGVVDPGAGNVFRNAVLNQFGSLANAKVDANGAYGVRALNLGTPGVDQDQLVIVPLVPEPAAAVIFVGGAMMLMAKRRRF